MDYYSESVLYNRELCKKYHYSTAHFYDKKPYIYHLDMVYEVAYKYKHLLPERYTELVFIACYTHDLIEDCRFTYHDVRKQFGGIVAEITYAVSTEKGKTRKERANEKYYDGIRNTQYATFVKLCDRIANVRHSKDTQGHSKFEMYKDEHKYFSDMLYSDEYKEMWDELDELLS